MVVHLDSIIFMLVESKEAKLIQLESSEIEMKLIFEMKYECITQKSNQESLSKSQEREMKGMRTQKSYT